MRTVNSVFVLLAVGCVVVVESAMNFDLCYDGLAEEQFFAHPDDCSWFLYCINSDLEPGICPDNT